MSPALRAALLGAVSFGAASVAVFATVAYGERWLYLHLGLWGAYLLWTVLFIGLGGAALLPLAAKDDRGARFFGRFALAFFSYAVAWCAAYFLLKGRPGEVLGGALGAVVLVGVLTKRVALLPAGVLIVTHSVGYFLGSALHDSYGRPLGMLLWGVTYGLGVGAGLGVALGYSPRSNTVH